MLWPKTYDVVVLNPRNARNYAPIAERFAATEERFALTVERSDKTGAKHDLIYASIGRIGEKVLRGRSFVRIVGKSEAMCAKCRVTGASFDRTGAIYVAIVVTFARIGAMHAGTKT